MEEQGTWAAQKHSEAGYGRPVDRGVWTAKTVKRPWQQPAHPQYANYSAPLTRKRHTMPHSAQSQHANYWAPRTRKRHQQEHRPQRPTESSDPTQHAKGRTGDRPSPRKGATTGRNVTQGVRPTPTNTKPDPIYTLTPPSQPTLSCRSPQPWLSITSCPQSSLDPRFEKLVTDAEFSIEGNHPKLKKRDEADVKKLQQLQIAGRRKRRAAAPPAPEEEPAPKKVALSDYVAKFAAAAAARKK